VVHLHASRGAASVAVVSDVIRIGGRTATVTDAARWIDAYFSEDNRVRPQPYAHPAYDEYDTGSSTFELNDGDLLAPTLLNAAPTARAFYSLQRVRPQLTEALGRIPVGLTLSESVRRGTMPALLGDLVAVLDGPEPPTGASLTTLLKVLHRKRPDFIPLYDQFVRRCYVGPGEPFPVHRQRRRSWRDYAVAIAHAMDDDLSGQREVFTDLHRPAPPVSRLRLLDVLAWKIGQRVAAGTNAAGRGMAGLQEHGTS
jgi:hypothetical protein